MSTAAENDPFAGLKARDRLHSLADGLRSDAWGLLMRTQGDRFGPVDERRDPFYEASEKAMFARRMVALIDIADWQSLKDSLESEAESLRQKVAGGSQGSEVDRG